MEIPDKGNYCLIIKIDCTIKIGAKGNIDFKKGYYVYVGSALGTLSNRIKRHLSNDKKKHWHVDYLLLNKNTEIKEVIYTYCTKKIECNIAYNIQLIILKVLDVLIVNACLIYIILTTILML